jgi:peptide subunit release factor RF-3
MTDQAAEISGRQTFAIISHPDHPHPDTSGQVAPHFR